MKLHSILKRSLILGLASSIVLSYPALADEDSPLYKSMKDTNKALKLLRSIEKTDWAGGAAAAQTAAAASLEGMKYLPHNLTDMEDGKEKSLAIADFRRLMGMSYASLCNLEIAYLSEDQALVDAAMKEVKAVKKEGHKKYED